MPGVESVCPCFHQLSCSQRYRGSVGEGCENNPVVRGLGELQDGRLGEVGPGRLFVLSVPLRLLNLRVKLDGSEPSSHEEKGTSRIREPVDDLSLDPVDLLLELMSVLSRHGVVEDDQVGTVAVDLSVHAKSLDCRGSFTRVTSFGVHVDRVCRPRRTVRVEAPIRSELHLETLVGVVGPGKAILDRPEEPLGHLLGLRHDDDTDIRVLADTPSRVVHRDRRALRMLRRSVDDDHPRVTLLEDLVLVEVPGGTSLKDVVPLELVLEELGVQVLLTERGEVRHAVTCLPVTLSSLHQLAALVVCAELLV